MLFYDENLQIYQIILRIFLVMLVVAVEALPFILGHFTPVKTKLVILV